MDADDTNDRLEAHEIVRAYMAVLEQHYRANEPFPMPSSTLPHAKQLIKRSMREVVGSLSAARPLTEDMRGVLEIAYTSLADYLDDELVQVMREYNEAMSSLEADEAGRGREKTGTAAWGRIAESGSLVARIAQSIADETDTLRSEFQQFAQQVVRGAGAPT